MATRQTSTGKENNTSNTTTVWDHIIALEGSVSGDASKVGDLTQLNTTDKTSIVNAVKEVKTQANSNASSLAEIATDPKTYGAKFDGVTDDTNAFNSASAKSKNIYVPEGSTVIQSSVWNQNNLTGKGTVIFKETIYNPADPLQQYTIGGKKDLSKGNNYSPLDAMSIGVEGTPNGYPYQASVKPILRYPTRPVAGTNINPWGQVFLEQGNSYPSNTRIQIRNFSFYGFYKDLNKWVKLKDNNYFGYLINEDYSGSSSVADIRDEVEGISVKLASANIGKAFHFFNNQFPLDNSNIIYYITKAEMRLIQDDVAQTSDFQNAHFVASVGCDWVDETNGNTTSEMYDGQFRRITTQWKTFYGTNMIFAQSDYNELFIGMETKIKSNQNMLKNSTFAQGKTDWVDPASNSVFSNVSFQNGGLVVTTSNAGGSNIQTYQNVTVKPNTRYTVSADFLAPNNNMQLFAGEFDISNNYLGGYALKGAKFSSNWNRNYLILKTKSNTSYIQLSFQVFPSSGIGDGIRNIKVEEGINENPTYSNEMDIYASYNDADVITFTPQNSWVVSVAKVSHKNKVVYGRFNLNGGTMTAGTVLGSIPSKWAPPDNHPVLFSAQDNNLKTNKVGYAWILTNGNIQINDDLITNNRLVFSFSYLLP